MGNPFLDSFPEIITLDSRNCMDQSVVNDLYSLEDIGLKQYQKFAKSVLEDHTHSIHEPIKKNSLKRPQPKPSSNQSKKIKLLQNNVALMQSRDGDLKEFFSYEIQSFHLLFQTWVSCICQTQNQTY